MYEQLRREVDWEHKHPKCAVLHSAGFDNSGSIRVADLWEPKQDFNIFVNSRLKPVMESINVHSLDIHGIEGPNQALLASVKPGESKTLRATANKVGVFVYHCDGDNLNGIWEYIASRMYGAIIVHPKNEKPAKEFYLVFGEIYNTADKGLFLGTGGNSNTISDSNATTDSSDTLSTTTTATGGIPLLPTEIGSFDMSKFIANKPDLILTNDMAYKHVPFIGTETKMILNEDAEVFKVRPGELTRWYIVNAGPRGHLSFNFAAGMTITDPNTHNFSFKNIYDFNTTRLG
jgi:hypothetical protein